MDENIGKHPFCPRFPLGFPGFVPGFPNNYDVEKPAYDVQDQVNREIKEKKKQQN